MSLIEKSVWSTQDIVKAIVYTAIVVFAATMIWSRFLFMESEISTNSRRLNTKTERLERMINENAAEIKKMHE